MDKHDEDTSRLYFTVGQGITLWSKMENVLVFMFAILMPVTLPKAGLVLYSINFNQWLHLIDELLADSDFVEARLGWNKLKSELKALSDTRNVLAHHQVDRDVDERPSLVPSAFDSRSKTLKKHPLSVEDIQEFSTKVNLMGLKLDAVSKLIENVVKTRAGKSALGAT